MDRDFIERALRLARGGYADGGDAEVQSNGMPVISDGQVNWGDSSNAADFVRADQAMRAMRSSPAAPDPQAAPMPMQRRAPAPAPYSAPRDVPLPPVRPANLGQPVFQNSSPEGPGAYNPDDGFPARPPGQYADPAMLFDPDMMAKGFTPPLEAPSAPPPPAPPAPSTDELLALLSNPTKSVASAAIDQAAPVAKFTDRAAPGISMTPQQRDLIIRTIAAESSGKTPEEGQGIAHVIMNRIASGRYGKTPEKVLFAPKQFEPWADPRGSNYPMRHKPGMAKYEKAQAALDAAMGGDDITGGATLFWGPKAQAALGRPAPKWGRTGGLDIGETRFHREDGGEVSEGNDMDSYATRALYLARGGYATPGFVDDQPEEEYPDGARPLTIHLNPNRNAAAGAIDAAGSPDASYDPMGGVSVPATNNPRMQGQAGSTQDFIGSALDTVAKFGKDFGNVATPTAEWLASLPGRATDYFSERSQRPDPSQRIVEDISNSTVGRGLPLMGRYAGQYFSDVAGGPDPSQRFANDIRHFGGEMLHEMKERPGEALANMLPFLGEASAGPEVQKLSALAAAARERGDGETANKFDALAATMATGAFIPGMKSVVGKAGAKLAENTVARQIPQAAERGIVEAATSAIPTTEGEAVRALAVAREGTPPADVVHGLTGVFAPENAPVRGETGKEILAMQRNELSPQDLDKLNDLRANNPEFSRASTFLLPGELKTVIDNPAQIEPMMRLLDIIPNSAHMASLAKAGAPKQGWYRGSTQALIDVFGEKDAPRFAALLAATSPQTSVESNLMNTLNIWKNWEAAGRPTNPDAIKRVMGMSVQGTKGEESILGAWIGNTYRALATEDPRKIVLSGPKVNSFFRNLADDVYRVTNDAWISNATNIDQGLLRSTASPLQLEAGNPGLSPGYLALNTRQREAGNMVRMLPSEAQETTWSFAMPLMEGARKAGMSARDFLQRGLLTRDVIRGTPDFSTLLKENPQYSRVINEMGRGEQLANMPAFNFPRELPQMTAEDMRNLEKTAATLDELRARRDRESRAYAHGYNPEQETTFAHQTLSGIPGRDTGVAEKLIDAPEGTREHFAGRVSNVFQNQVGENIINKALGLNVIPTVPSIEVFRPDLSRNAMPTGMATSKAHQVAPASLIETGRTGYTNSAEVPVQRTATGKNPRLPKDIARKLEVSNTLHGAMTAQRGSPYHALVGDEKGLGTSYKMPGKYKAEEHGQNVGLAGALVDEPFAIADTGRGVNVFPIDNVKKMDDAEREYLRGTVGAESFQPVTNIAPGSAYVDLANDFMAGIGSKAVAGKLVTSLKKLTKDEFTALDNADLRRAAGALHKMYASQAKKKNPVREDFMNMLSIIRDKGLAGLRKAYKNPDAFLPAVAATMGVGAAASGRSNEGQQ